MSTFPDNNPMLSDFSAEEWLFLQQATPDLTESQKKYFFMAYADKRKRSQDILLLTLLGFAGFAGIHRFVMGQVGMGILYFVTFGFCSIGTIVDIVNNKSLTLKYNKDMAYESYQAAKMSL